MYALRYGRLTTAAAGGQANVYVAFVMENTGTGDNWFLDDVQIVQLCPNATTPVATPTGQTTAQLSWANPGAVPSFDIEIVALPGTPTGVPTYTAVTNKSFQRNYRIGSRCAICFLRTIQLWWGNGSLDDSDELYHADKLLCRNPFL